MSSAACELLEGRKGCACVGLGTERKGGEARKLFAAAAARGLAAREAFGRLSAQGSFVLAPSSRLKTGEILPV